MSRRPDRPQTTGEGAPPAAGGKQRAPGPRRGRGGPGRRGPRSTPQSEQARAARLERRRALVPVVTYPEQLPVSQRKDDIAAAIRDHQVVVVAGETGSGKTTQLPKICLELGRGVAGTIGHTQPRRIAARSVAERIAEELGAPLAPGPGEAPSPVGYQVRFTDTSHADTLVKVMTDGILLAELQRDRDLRRYDTLIIDEAHERSLNIDFILGYLRQLLPRRPDLKVIITSATIDPERFARHFAAPDGTPAPIIEVSGRTFPVEVRYRPLVENAEELGTTTMLGGVGAPPVDEDAQEDDDQADRGGEGDDEVEPGAGDEDAVDQVTGIVRAVEELWSEPRSDDGGPQDVLVFCSGEQEIRDAVDALEGLRLPGTEVLPLYARLSAAEQHRVFRPGPGRRVIVSTNVAETSLTVPGIRYVVDTGTARISRYSQRLKVQRLPIEAVSQASANQRAGRCGRIADGIAIRLYAQSDFEARPEFTEPEIQRTSLASVILQMTALGLGDVARFPFVDPPDARMVADGRRLLHELGALDAEGRLTRTGRDLARLPLDPRMGRMLLEASRTGCLREMLVIVAAMSIQDPRERPAEAREKADQYHARYRTGPGETSDFMALLQLWEHMRTQQRELGSSAFRRMCKREYLHYLRLREWQDLHAQLRQQCRQLGLAQNDSEPSPDTVHQALLTGLLGHVGLRDAEKRDYQGARGARFHIQPGSALFRRGPDWVMAAELVETTRLWARTVAGVQPEWVERAAAHLVKRQYSEPHWSRKRASVVASERVTLYGVPLVAGRMVAYGAIDPELSRELFIRHALVEGEWETRHGFFAANRELLEEVGELEARTRRRDLRVSDEELVAFYEERIPEQVVSGAHFDAWWKRQQRQTPRLLHLTADDLLEGEDAAGELSALAESGFPRTWVQPGPNGAGPGHELALTYQFEPGADADGVTVHIPLAVLNQVGPEGFDWSVPGLRAELATALVKSLPKATRKHVVPAPDRARAALERVADSAPAASRPAAEPLTQALARGLREVTGHPVPAAEMDLAAVPDHLRMTFRVEDGRGKALGEGKDLEALQAQLRPRLRQTMAQAAQGIEQQGLTSWSFGTLPSDFRRDAKGGQTLQGYPALIDHGDSVAIEVLSDPHERDHRTRAGVRRLLILGISPPWKRLLSLLTNEQRLALGHAPHGSVPALLDDALAAAVDSVIAEQPGGTVRTPEEFETALARTRQQVVPRVLEIVEHLVPVLTGAREARLAVDRMATLPSAGAQALAADVRAQLDALIRPGFVTDAGWSHIRHLPRYLRGIAERLEKAPADLHRDAERRAVVETVERERARLLASLGEAERHREDVRELRWMVEELRVSLFAQRLGTAHPVSEKRIYQAMDRIEDALGR